MQTLRTIAAVVIGYILYAAASMLFIGPVMERSGLVVSALALVSLVLIGLLAGFVAAKVAGPRAGMATVIVAGLVVVATLVNLAMNLGLEPLWYKVGTIALTAPAIVVMGRRTQRERR